MDGLTPGCLHLFTWLFCLSFPSVSVKSEHVFIRISVRRDIAWFELLDCMMKPWGRVLFATMEVGGYRQNLMLWPTSYLVWFLLQAAVFIQFQAFQVPSLIPEPIVFLYSGLNSVLHSLRHFNTQSSPRPPAGSTV